MKRRKPKRFAPFWAQATEFDCVPTTIVNALSWLFSRDKIPSKFIRQIYLCCLDMEKGTSSEAISYLAYWMNEHSSDQFAIEVKYLKGKSVNLSRKGIIVDALNNGYGVGMQVMRGKAEHYILLLRSDDAWFYAFDPYIRKKIEHPEQLFEFIPSKDAVQGENIKISHKLLKYSDSGDDYSVKGRECLIMSRREG